MSLYLRPLPEHGLDETREPLVGLETGGQVGIGVEIGVGVEMAVWLGVEIEVWIRSRGRLL